METKKLLIGGRWRETSKTFEVKNPFTREILAEVCEAGENEMEETVAAAVSAREKLRGLARFQIYNGLAKIADSIERRKKEFAETITLESAKPILLANGEVERAIQTFRWAAEEAKRFTGEVVPLDTQPAGRGKTAWTEMIPRGVIFGITPFNFPLNLVAHKVAPALASKNAIIIKPSPRTPLTALLLGEVFLESGLPEAAFQLVNTRVSLLENIYSDPRIAMISFTGSAEIGWQIKAKVGRKQVALELGGNAPVIFDETSDWRTALDRSVTAAFAYAGQVCISAQRFYLHETIFEEWSENFVKKAEELRKGNPLDETNALSVMIDENAAIRAEKWVNEAISNGARLLCGNRREGALLEATVLTGTIPEMRVVSEEIFAPVAVIEKFHEFEEAVQMANSGQYGLQCGVFTNQIDRMRFAAENLEYGSVLINEMPVFRVDNMPYGGVKNSGFGREGVRYAMEEMSEIRLIVVNS